MNERFSRQALVAAFNTSHRHHQPSFDLLRRCGKSYACCGAHSLAEVYATLTGMPVPHGADPDHVMLYIRDLGDRLSLVALDEREYFQTLEASAAAGLASGASYDSLLGHCALKAAQSIYTWTQRIFCDCHHRSPAA